MVRSALIGMTILSGGQVALAQNATGGAGPQIARPSQEQRADSKQDAVQPQDIVVTATRQEQVLSKVPVSVQAFTTKQMDEKGVRQIDDLATLSPGLSFQRSTYGNGSTSNIAIRGINSTVGAATTGIYIDDTPIQVRQLGFTASNTYPEVFDLDRVEVVRGPQGTLFGAGAEGGAVRFITPQPDLHHTEVYGRSEVAFTEHGDPSYEGGAAVSTPLVADKIAVRASAWYRRDGGYVDRTDYAGNVIDNDSNSQASLVGKVAVTFAPTETLKITPSIYYQRIHVADASGIWLNLSEAHGDYKQAGVVAQPSTDRFILPTLNVTWNNDAVSLVAVSSYFDRRSRALFDYTAFTNGTFARNSVPFIPGYLATAQMNNRQKNFTQEVRLQSADPDARLKWVVGGFYSHARQYSFDETVDPFFADLVAAITPIIVGVPLTVEQFTGSPVLPGNVTYLNTNRGLDKQLAGFVQLDWRPLDGLTLTAGARVSRTTFAFDTYQAGPGAGTISLRSSGSQKQTPVTPKFGVSYQATPDMLVYASAAKGFRIGGVNSPVNPTQCGPNLQALGLAAAPESYQSDSVWSYEGGAKGALFERKLRFEASGYYIKWHNIQQSVYLPLCGALFTNNSGSASSRGFDLSLQASIAPRWTLGLTAGYVDARYDTTFSAGLGSNYVTKGDRLPGSPWTVDVALRGEFGLFSRRLYLRADYDHQSAYSRHVVSQDAANGSYDPGATPADQTSEFSARLGTRLGGLDLSVFVNNILDEKPDLSKAHYSTFDPIYTTITLRPRTAGLTGIYRF